MRLAIRILTILAILAAVLLLLVLAAMWYLSSPDRATPVLRDGVAAMTGREVELGEGWVEFAWQPGLRLRQLRLEEVGQVAVFDARIDIPGLLFSGRPLNFVRIENGGFRYRMRGQDGDGGPPAILENVHRVAIRELRLDIQRPGRDPALLVLTRAEGNLETGDFSLAAAGNGSVVRIRGSAEGLSLDGLRGEMEMHGRNFAELAAVFGLAAPDTPPFSFTGNVRHEGGIWNFSPFEGVVGDSDLAGTLAAEFGGERPLLIANITSQSLDFDDLGVAVGAPSSVERTVANDEQRIANAAFERSNRFIPNARLDFDRVRNADARLRFSAQNVQAGPVPLSAMEIEMALENGVMTFSPLAFDTQGGGRLTVYATIDATQNPVHSDVRGELSAFDLDQIAGGRLARGSVVSRFDLTTDGSDLRSAFASADGEIAMWASPDAQIRHLAVEGAGLDIGEVLLVMLTEDEENPEYLPVRCAGARFVVEDGIARASPVILDTSDSVMSLSGRVSLRDESLDLEVRSDQKDVSWGNLFGGVQIDGRLRDPDIGVDAASTLLQGGIAGLLSAIAGPLGAIPFTDVGTGESVSCDALAERARSVAPSPSGG